MRNDKRPFCGHCLIRDAAGICCSAHNKALCHGCYRRSHFVEVCAVGCVLCGAEELEPTAPVPPSGARAIREADLRG